MNRVTAGSKPVQRLTLIASVLGLIPATALSVRIFSSLEQPEAWVFALLYVSPYLLVLTVSGMRDNAARGGVLLALGLISLAASLSSLAGVALVLLPTTGTIFYASAWSMRLTKHQKFRISVYFLSSLLTIAAFIAFSIYTLVRLLG